MDDTWLYHEQQESALCGQHCLNNLLQGPYFSAPDLAQIAEELDAKERSHMLENGIDTHTLKYLSEASGNVSDDGNFSIQVLSLALKRLCSIDLTSWSSSEGSNAVQDPTLQEAYIVNRSSHWFSVRKIDGVWWNLNSMNTTPERVSDFYLAAFLGQLRTEGYSVFIVVGDLPPSNKQNGTEMGGAGLWYKASTLVPKANAPENKFAGKGYRLGGPKEEPVSDVRTVSEEEMVAEAIKASLGEGVDPDLEHAIKMSLAESSGTAAVSGKSSQQTKEEIRAARLAALDRRAAESKK